MLTHAVHALRSGPRGAFGSARPRANLLGVASESRLKTLALIGFMGAGKTLIGALVAQRAGAPFHDLDLLIESHAGMTIAEIFVVHGEPEFRAMESKLLPEVLAPGAVTALGGGTPGSEDNWKLISERATSVFLDVPLETLWARLSGGAGRPLARRQSKEQLGDLLSRRRPRYLEATHVVNGDRDASVVAEEVLLLWSG